MKLLEEVPTEVLIRILKSERSMKSDSRLCKMDLVREYNISTYAHIVKTINGLEEAGLIVMDKSENRHTLGLTQQGEKVADSILDVKNEMPEALK